jgi:hypothetical protein
MPVANIQKYLVFFGDHCNPPFPHKGISTKIESALNRAKSRERNLRQEIFDWVSVTNRYFNVTDCDRELQIVTKEEKANRRVIFHRLVKDGVLEKHPEREGIFRRVLKECEEIDFLNAPTETVPLRLPFDIEKMVEIMPGNIIVVAGEQNAGKTGFLLNAAKLNMQRFEINYFSSEMGASELKKRLSLFDDLNLSDWKLMKVWERSENFGDVIVSGGGKINIIDYLELHDNFYEVGGKMAEIHRKLNGALAIIALQKNPGTNVGLGGFRSLEKPRLYLAMEPRKLKIVKAKNWNTSRNPNGLEIDFKLAQGSKFIPQGDWSRP